MSLGIKPIVEKFLEKNYLFALEFREGFVFGRVVRRRICCYKPYALIDATGAAVDISPSTHQSELRFRDPRRPENEVIYLDTTTNSGYPWFLHGSIGIKPQFINMYPRFPEAKDIPGKFPNVDPVRPSSGDDLGYVNSLLSPYDEPTDFVEYVIPPLQHLSAEYYNKDSLRSHQPVLNLLFSVYWFEVLTKDRYATLIGKIARRDVPASFLTVGFGDSPLDMGETLKKDWKAELFSLGEASTLGGK